MVKQGWILSSKFIFSKNFASKLQPKKSSLLKWWKILLNKDKNNKDRSNFFDIAAITISFISLTNAFNLKKYLSLIITSKSETTD